MTPSPLPLPRRGDGGGDCSGLRLRGAVGCGGGGAAGWGGGGGAVGAEGGGGDTPSSETPSDLRKLIGNPQTYFRTHKCLIYRAFLDFIGNAEIQIGLER